MHGMLHIGSPPKQAGRQSLSRDLRAQVPDLQRKCLVLEVFKPWHQHTALVPAELVASLTQSTLEFIPGSVESGGRSNDCHVILQPKYA